MNHARLITFFETLDEKVSLDDFQSIYAHGVHFKNPFYAIHDVSALYHFFQDLYQKVDSPEIVISESVSEGKIMYLKWTLHFSFRDREEAQNIEGVSRIVFDTRGKIREHTDFWDAAENIYETLPLLGTVMRWVKKKIKS